MCDLKAYPLKNLFSQNVHWCVFCSKWVWRWRYSNVLVGKVRWQTEHVGCFGGRCSCVRMCIFNIPGPCWIQFYKYRFIGLFIENYSLFSSILALPEKRKPGNFENILTLKVLSQIGHIGGFLQLALIQFEWDLICCFNQRACLNSLWHKLQTCLPGDTVEVAWNTTIWR